jgi:hypothetical protein
MSYSYTVLVHYQHPKWGPQNYRVTVDASSIRVALAHGLKHFFRQYQSGGTRNGPFEALKCDVARIGKARKEAPDKISNKGGS